jgi:hypothetical protein
LLHQRSSDNKNLSFAHDSPPPARKPEVTMSTTVRRFRFVAILATMSLATFAGPTAWSNVIPAFAGRAGIDADNVCFPMNQYGPIVNTCASSRWFLIPIATSAAATHTAYARVKGNGTVATQCRAVALSGTGAGGNAHMTFISSTTSTTLTVLTMSPNLVVAADETYHIECFVAPGGGVISIAD